MSRDSNSHSVQVVAAGTSMIAQAASSLSSGQWRRLGDAGTTAPTNVNLYCEPTGGHSLIRTGFATKMARDPRARSGNDGQNIYFIGCDHAQAQSFIRYDEVANSCSLLTATPFAGGPLDTKHGYEHSVWDTVTNSLWHKPANLTSIYKWAGPSNPGSWTQYGLLPDLGYGSVASGVEWNATLGRIIVAQENNNPNGKCIGVNPSNPTDRVVYSSSLNPLDQYHTIAHHNRNSGWTIVGCGNSGNNLWKINNAGVFSGPITVPSYVNPGAIIGPGTPSTLCVANPATGGFLFMNSGSTWYDYNPATDAFTPRGASCEVLAANVQSPGKAWGVVAVPIYNEPAGYGNVIVFAKAYSSTNAEMWVFKP